MPKTAVSQWSTTRASNSDIDGINIAENCQAGNINDAIREIMVQVKEQLGGVNFKGADLASATTTDLSTATGNVIDITGTTTITGLGTVAAGQVFILQFDGILTLTHNATSLILPGAANITTAAGDIAVVVSEGSGNWRCVSYQRSSGGIVTSAGQSQQESANSAIMPVTPSVQQYHPSAAKAWARVTESGGSYALAAGYNIASVSKNATGNVTVNFATDFSSANYACVVTPEDSGASASANTPAAGSIVVRIFDATPTAYDDGFYLVAFGDQ